MEQHDPTNAVFVQIENIFTFCLKLWPSIEQLKDLLPNHPMAMCTLGPESDLEEIGKRLLVRVRYFTSDDALQTAYRRGDVSEARVRRNYKIHALS